MTRVENVTLSQTAFDLLLASNELENLTAQELRLLSRLRQVHQDLIDVRIKKKTVERSIKILTNGIKQVDF